MGFVPNVSEAVPDSPPHVSVRPSCRCAPFRPTFQAFEHCRTIRNECRSWLRQDDGLPQCSTILPARYVAALGERSAWHHALSRPTRGRSRGFALLPIQFVSLAIHACTVADNTRVYQHTGIRTKSCVPSTLGVYFSTGSCIRPLVPLEFVASRILSLIPIESKEGPCGFLGRMDMPTIDAAPSLAQLVHNSDRTAAQQFPPCSQPLASTIRIVSPPETALVAGASCGRRWARLLASITSSSRGQESRSFRSSLLPLHSLQKRQLTVHRRLRFHVPGADLSQVHLVPTCSDEGGVVRPCPSQLPQTHNDGTRRATDLAPRRLQAYQSLLPSPGLVQIGIVQLFVPDCLRSCHDGLNSARVHRIALMRGQSPGERPSRMFAWQASSNRGPEGLQPRRRHAHAPHAVQAARHEPRLGDLARDRAILLVEIDFGHPLFGFGQPRVLRSALPRRPSSVRVDAQDARVRDDPHRFE